MSSLTAPASPIRVVANRIAPIMFPGSDAAESWKLSEGLGRKDREGGLKD